MTPDNRQSDENTWQRIQVDEAVPEGMVRIDGRDYALGPPTWAEDTLQEVARTYVETQEYLAHNPDATLEILGPATPEDPDRHTCIHRWRDTGGSRSQTGTLINYQQCQNCGWLRRRTRTRTDAGWTTGPARPPERPPAVTAPAQRRTNPNTCTHQWVPASRALNTSGDYWRWAEQCTDCGTMRMMACTGRENIPDNVTVGQTSARGGRATMVTHDEADTISETTYEYMRRMGRADTPFLRTITTNVTTANPMGWNYPKWFLNDHPPLPDHRPDPYVARRRQMMRALEGSDAYRAATMEARADMARQVRDLSEFDRKTNVLEEGS